MSASEIAGRIYPAKSAKLELIDLLQEQLCAPYQTPGDRASITRTILSRVVDDLKHGVQILDALQDERQKNVNLVEAPLRHAKLVEEMIQQQPWADKPDARVALAVAGRAIRRGRHLTEAEKLRNLADAMEAEDIEAGGDLSGVTAHLRREAARHEQERKGCDK